MFVEDESAIRRLGVRVLESSGYRVIVASNGGEALALFERAPSSIDLLVTDVVMPGVSGSELARQLRAVRPGLKVLFTSGYTDDAIVRLGVLDNPETFLAKPYNSSSLARKVRTILDGHPAKG